MWLKVDLPCFSQTGAIIPIHVKSENDDKPVHFGAPYSPTDPILYRFGTSKNGASKKGI
jgi:hypothetical protein